MFSLLIPFFECRPLRFSQGKKVKPVIADSRSNISMEGDTVIIHPVDKNQSSVKPDFIVKGRVTAENAGPLPGALPY
ncbi:MAG: hypothetical protein MI921_23070 [Cytophagales bacterium]|nr:hypothetical protein [Cytophagales bacterium]